MSVRFWNPIIHKVPERIVEARHAIYDRAAENPDLTDPSSIERRAVNNALRILALLEGVTARKESA
jgi:hypothetical protein